MAKLLEELSLRGTFAALPTDNSPSKTGRFYATTDTNQFFRDNGTTWDEVIVPGTGGGLPASADIVFFDGWFCSNSTNTSPTIDHVNGSLAPNLDISGGNNAVADSVVAGNYFIQGSVSLEVVEGPIYKIRLLVLVNGSPVCSREENYNPSSPTTVVKQVSTPQQYVTIADGDVISIAIYQDTGSGAQAFANISSYNMTNIAMIKVA